MNKYLLQVLVWKLLIAWKRKRKKKPITATSLPAFWKEKCTTPQLILNSLTVLVWEETASADSLTVQVQMRLQLHSGILCVCCSASFIHVSSLGKRGIVVWVRVKVATRRYRKYNASNKCIWKLFPLFVGLFYWPANLILHFFDIKYLKC